MNEAKLSREEQVELGKKIAALVEKEVGSVFAADSNQGAGVIAILKIVAHKEDVTNKIKKFLRVDLGLALQNGKENHKNHGSGMKCTALVNLAEIRLDAVKRIENLHKLTCVEKVKPVVVKKSQSSADDVTVKSVIEKATEIVPISTDSFAGQKTARGDERKRKFSPRVATGKRALTVRLITFLSTEEMLKSENFDRSGFIFNKYFSCDDQTKDECVLKCADEKVASQIDDFITWLVGPKFVLCVDSEVTVNFPAMKNVEEKPYGIHFCLPPDENSTPEEVTRRLLHAYNLAKVKSITKDEISFKVYLKKAKIALTAQSILSEMGWNVLVGEDESLRILFGRRPKVEHQTISEIIPPVKEVLPIENENTQIESAHTVSAGSELHENPEVVSPENEEQAIALFKQVLDDPKQCAELSDELILEMQIAVEAYQEKVKREAYLKGLLNKFFKK